jgi:FkbM family methyltransferase
MDYWPQLPPVAQLPLRYRSWAWWLRNGPKRAEGTLGGSAMFRLIARSMRGPAFFTLHADGRPRLTIDLHDFESFHHALPVWYRGDEELGALQEIMKDGGTLIDGGANYGAYALRIAQIPGTRVIAVEPQAAVAEALRRSAKENGFARFEVVEAALSDRSGTAALAVGFGSGSASLERVAPGARNVSVRAITLDELQAGEVRCIKLDVEEAEARVLRGGGETLARCHPVVLFEAGAAQPQDEVFAILRSFGYTQFVDQSGGPPRLDAALTNVIARRVK